MAISPIRGQPNQTVDIVAIVVQFSLAPPAVGMNIAPVSPRLQTDIPQIPGSVGMIFPSSQRRRNEIR
jgi:hypothetical protein